VISYTLRIPTKDQEIITDLTRKPPSKTIVLNGQLLTFFGHNTKRRAYQETGSPLDLSRQTEIRAWQVTS
jgi:hypothetical protein